MLLKAWLYVVTALCVQSISDELSQWAMKCGIRKCTACVCTYKTPPFFLWKAVSCSCKTGRRRHYPELCINDKQERWIFLTVVNLICSWDSKVLRICRISSQTSGKLHDDQKQPNNLIRYIQFHCATFVNYYCSRLQHKTNANFV